VIVVTSVKVKSLGKLQQLVLSGDHFFIADSDHEGDGQFAPNPYEMLLASIAT